MVSLQGNGSCPLAVSNYGRNVLGGVMGLIVLMKRSPFTVRIYHPTWLVWTGELFTEALSTTHDDEGEDFD